MHIGMTIKSIVIPGLSEKNYEKRTANDNDFIFYHNIINPGLRLHKAITDMITSFKPLINCKVNDEK